MGILLLIAAESRELRGFARRLKNVRKAPWPLDYARTAERGSGEAILAANGPGRVLAGEAVRIALENVLQNRNSEDLTAVVSTGYCGALDGALNACDVFVATSVNGILAATPRASRPFHSGPLISVDRVASTAAEKAELRKAGSLCVEMEAAAVAEAAAERHVPFYCVRVVTDTANESFPLDFNRYRGGDGRFRRGRIALAALSNPAILIPALMKLDRSCLRASEALGDFLADCRF